MKRKKRKKLNKRLDNLDKDVQKQVRYELSLARADGYSLAAVARTIKRIWQIPGVEIAVNIIITYLLHQSMRKTYYYRTF